MKEANVQNIVFKNLTWFFIASAALIAAGFLAADNQNYFHLTLLAVIDLTGVFLVYRLNDCIDQDLHVKFNLEKFFRYTLHKVVFAVFVFVLIPLAIFLLPKTSLFILSISAIIGTLYSLSFQFGGFKFRLKNIFLVKNILIGTIWGNLILIGAGETWNNNVIILFFFTCGQVLIGGIIRDIPDIEKDRQHGVQSIPLTIGTKQTLIALHIINLLSLALAVYVDWDIHLVMVFGVTIIWRMINLILMGHSPSNPLWSQWMNLFNCVIIFLMLLLLRLYGNL